MARARAFLHPQTAYPRWRDRQLATEWPPIELRFGTGTDIVIGVAVGYRYETLLPFIRTLRSVSRCRALLVVNDAALAARLAEHEIDTVMWQREPGYAPHVNFARVGAVFGVLRALRGISRAFLLDTRDVVFQSEPFSQLPDGRLRFFTEAAGQTFDRERTNRAWLVGAMGPHAPALFGKFEIVCAGTVAGSVESLIEYCRLKLFLGAFFSARRHLETGVDQLTTNMIARFRMLPDFETMPFDGPVATPCYLNAGMLLLEPDGFYRFINGVTPSVIHQYDRAGEMWNWFNGVRGGPGTQGQAIS